MVFYGRVSTEHEAQLSALENQIQWYDDQAKYHSNWNMMDKYIDEGITGTQAKKRPAFLRMLEDARQGKFDLIVTREVCRFARNTVDTLVTTRELKNLGIEVYFVEDNIWTMDGDGELRLTLMATLAQEESRKVSERVRAGQKISRDNGVIYGNGNILGYDRIGDKYIINREQAETVRMIFDMYLYEDMGTMRIANELTQRKRVAASGVIKWTCSNVSRILGNATYMGYIAYGKSFSNNYLEQKRINNLDRASYMYVKGDFEPIISEEDWYKCEKIRNSRMAPSLSKAVGIRKTHCKADTKDIWASKLRCSCGASFRKNRWHKNNGCDWSYGYQCYNQLNNGAARKRREAGMDDTGYCDMQMIADWKLELMSKIIMENLWSDRKGSIQTACQLIQECYKTENPKQVSTVNICAQIEQIKSKIENLIDMRTEGDISKEEYKSRRESLDSELQKLNTEMQAQQQDVIVPINNGLRWDAITETINQLIDFSQPKLSREILEKFVAKVVPLDNNRYRWFLNIDSKTTIDIDLATEGRKTNPNVYIDNSEDEKSSIHITDLIYISELYQALASKKYSTVATLHRLLSRMAGRNKFSEVCLLYSYA